MRRALIALAAACACGDDGGDVRSRDRLSQTGLYDDIADKTVAGDLAPYEPAYQLWADGAGKRRWMRLPPGGEIDMSDPEHWRFPVGTQLFKEFSRDGVLLETRLIERVGDTGNDANDYWMGAFVWLPDGSDALLAPDGAADVNGTTHDVPSRERCWSCHQGEPGHILGVSQVQRDATAPGDATAATSLGTLHANCGHCHNPSGVAWPETQLELRLTGREQTVEETAAFRTAVGVAAQHQVDSGHTVRIVPGKPEESVLHERMGRRGDAEQMPPIATEQVGLGRPGRGWGVDPVAYSRMKMQNRLASAVAAASTASPGRHRAQRDQQHPPAKHGRDL